MTIRIIRQGAKGVLQSPESERNFTLAGGWKHLFTLKDANYHLCGDTLQPRRSYWFAPTGRQFSRGWIKFGRLHGFISGTRCWMQRARFDTRSVCGERRTNSQRRSPSLAMNLIASASKHPCASLLLVMGNTEIAGRGGADDVG